ncbi:MAG: trypsin-like peptidase domain-containing protein [Acidimicrobiales bacterium]|jgi:S1-C subfamily serine protease
MDEHNDEQRMQKTEALAPRGEPEATGAVAQEPSGTPFGPGAASTTWAGAAGQEASPAGPAGNVPGGFGPDGYRSFGFAFDAYPPPGYGAAAYTPGTAPGGYGPGGYPPGIYPPGPYGPTGDQRTQPGRPTRSRKLAAVAAAALVLVGVGGGAGIAYLSRQSAGTAAGLATSPARHSLTTSQIAAAVDPAVVDIDTNLGEGTGMIATSNGEIITNNHVVEGATTISVVIENRGTYKATVVGTDASADVAVLQVTGVTGLPTVKFGDSATVKIGSSVVAIGNAGGQGFPSTVTAGAVTALGRAIVASDEDGLSESLTGLIQTDALIEPGNSGGPLVNSSGQVIGMDTAAASADGATPIGFALRINKVLQIANDIEQGKAGHGIVIGTEAFLGIEGVTVSVQGSGSATGAGLEYVAPGTPAYQAGLQAGDVITAFDGHTTPTMSELASLIHKLRPGDRVNVTFESPYGGAETVTVTLGAAPPA